MTIPQPALSYLASLGFPLNHLTNPDGDPTYHPDHPGIFVAPRARSYNADYFRLGFDASVRSGLDRVYVGAPSIFPCLVDIKRPRWKQTVSKWFQKTIFATKPARTAAEERVAAEAQRRAQVAEIVGPDLAHTVPQIGQLCSFATSHETGEIESVGFNYRSFRWSWRYEEDRSHTVKDAHQRLRAIAAVLEAARANGIKLE
jgi:hypothetical protein